MRILISIAQLHVHEEILLSSQQQSKFRSLEIVSGLSDSLAYYGNAI
jgi:hypothetical protein